MFPAQSTVCMAAVSWEPSQMHWIDHWRTSAHTPPISAVSSPDTPWRASTTAPTPLPPCTLPCPPTLPDRSNVLSLLRTLQSQLT